MRGGVALGAALLGGLALCAPASAATSVGETFVPTSACNSATHLQFQAPGDRYIVPSAGVITSWSFSAGPSVPPFLQLKVGRRNGGNSFTMTGESAVESPATSVLNEFPTRISVQAGEIIGFYTDVAGGNCILSHPGGSGYAFAFITQDVPVGTTMDLNTGGAPDLQLDVAALVEPDGDGDGFGDETQDACPTDASTQADCIGPDTQITKGPKSKTKKKRSTFEFTSPEAGATFECSLNGAAFTPCASPLEVKAKKGKNSFAVRASDAAGNDDPTPAAADWKLKKKKRRKH